VDAESFVITNDPVLAVVVDGDLVSIPVAGSAYTYAYATLGEIVAWIIGWDLILEYGASVAAIAVGWGANLNAFLDTTFGIHCRND
jgi:amino acid transporter